MTAIMASGMESPMNNRPRRADDSYRASYGGRRFCTCKPADWRVSLFPCSKGTVAWVQGDVACVIYWRGLR
jgi:hypothetical protein